MTTVAPHAARRMRIVSLLPSATDMLCFVADPSWLVGRSHECDYPEEIQSLPMLTASRVKFESSRQMHESVNNSLSQGKGLYMLDAQLLQSLQPDLVLTQSLCEVCSVDLAVVERTCSFLQPPPAVLSFNPFSLDEVLEDMLRLGDALHLQHQAADRVRGLKARIQRVLDVVAARTGGKSTTGVYGASLHTTQSAPATPTNGHHGGGDGGDGDGGDGDGGGLGSGVGVYKPPTVAFLEWTDPVFCGGHWTPEIIALAGGSHPLNEAVIGKGAAASREIPDADVAAMDPDWVVICPCGFDIPTTIQEMNTLEAKPWWRQLRAHRENKVVLVDGNQMFNRPGPRLVDALEFLVGLLHDRHDLIPSDFPWQRYTLPPLAAAIPPARTPPLSATSPKPLSVAVGVNATQPAATTSALTAAPPLSATPAAAVAGIKEGVEEQGVLSRPPLLPREVAWCLGSAALNMPQDVEEAHLTALTANQRMYKDPISGYMAATEMSHLLRSKCCGSRCRHCPFGHYGVKQPPSSSWGRCNHVTVPVVLDKPKRAQFNVRKAQLRPLEGLEDLKTQDNKDVLWVVPVCTNQDTGHQVLLWHRHVSLYEIMDAACDARLLVLPAVSTDTDRARWVAVASTVLQVVQWCSQ